MGSLYNKGDGGNPFARWGQQQNRPDRTMGGFLGRPYTPGQSGGWGDANWGKLSSALAGGPQSGAGWRGGFDRTNATPNGPPPQASPGPPQGQPEQIMRTQGPGTGMAPPVQQQPQGNVTGGVMPPQPAAPAQPQAQPWMPDNSLNGGEWWKKNPAYQGPEVPYPGTTQVPKRPWGY